MVMGPQDMTNGLHLPTFLSTTQQLQAGAGLLGIRLVNRTTSGMQLQMHFQYDRMRDAYVTPSGSRLQTMWRRHWHFKAWPDQQVSETNDITVCRCVG